MKRKTRTFPGSLLVAVASLLWMCGTKPQHNASSGWALLPFEKVDSVNPVLLPGTNSFTCPIRDTVVKWENKDVFNPAAVVRNGKVYLLFRAEDTVGRYAGTSRIGLAESEDGLHFTKQKAPVLYPDNDSLKVFEWEGGVEDPRMVESETGLYVMTYTAYDGTTARLLLATSSDLEHWNKQGTVLQGKYKNSGASRAPLWPDATDQKLSPPK